MAVRKSTKKSKGASRKKSAARSKSVGTRRATRKTGKSAKKGARKRTAKKVSIKATGRIAKKRSTSVSQKGREAGLSPRVPRESVATESEASALESSNSTGDVDNMGGDNARVE